MYDPTSGALAKYQNADSEQDVDSGPEEYVVEEYYTAECTDEEYQKSRKQRPKTQRARTMLYKSNDERFYTPERSRTCYSSSMDRDRNANWGGRRYDNDPEERLRRVRERESRTARYGESRVHSYFGNSQQWSFEEQMRAREMRGLERLLELRHHNQHTDREIEALNEAISEIQSKKTAELEELKLKRRATAGLADRMARERRGY